MGNIRYIRKGYKVRKIMASKTGCEVGQIVDSGKGYEVGKIVDSGKGYELEKFEKKCEEIYSAGILGMVGRAMMWGNRGQWEGVYR